MKGDILISNGLSVQLQSYKTGPLVTVFLFACVLEVHSAESTQ